MHLLVEFEKFFAVVHMSLTKLRESFLVAEMQVNIFSYDACEIQARRLTEGVPREYPCLRFDLALQSLQALEHLVRRLDIGTNAAPLNEEHVPGE